jgi:peptidyl-dipeptidase Dcp
MKLILTVLITQLIIPLAAAQQPAGKEAVTNPFFTQSRTPFETPDFRLIRNEHYLPAFHKGIAEQNREIETITGSLQAPTFENTVEALEHTGILLDKVSSVFFGLKGANTNDQIQKIANDIAPLLSKHRDDIFLNDNLFRRIKTVYEQKQKLGLNPEQAKLLEETYREFVRGGINLAQEKKDRFRKINEELAVLGLKFEENVLKETNDFKLVIDNPGDLGGLSKEIIEVAAERADKAGLKGKWVFTLHKPVMIPFLQYAKNRQLRERLFHAYITRCNNGNAADNKAVISRIAALRVERANLLGYRTHADYVEEKNMSKTPGGVYELLDRLWTPALKNAHRERDEMQAIVDAEGGGFKIQPWDWWFYAEKVRKAKYDLDENELRPYFLMENVRKGAFEVATRLYGLQFIERRDIPKYVDEITAYEVKRKDGSHLGVLYTDYFPRPVKQAGAWCGGFRGQEIRGGKNITPLVYNVGNFTRPAGNKPALLSLDDVETLFHEFGHALHSLLQNQTYRSLSVPGDFVELPSQIMENWALDPEVLRLYAHHYETGQIIPQSLIGKVVNSRKFNQGFDTVEYLAACYLDMNWHSLPPGQSIEAEAFEKESLARIHLPDEIIVRYRSPYFAHIFSASSGYDAGYYYYIWAAVLDTDAFEAFKEKGIFDAATAEAFREHVLAKGATGDAMDQYVKFRGKKPSIEPLLRKRGLL